MRDCPSYNPQAAPSVAAALRENPEHSQTHRLSAGISRVRLTAGGEQKFPLQQPTWEKRNKKLKTMAIRAIWKKAPRPSCQALAEDPLL